MDRLDDDRAHGALTASPHFLERHDLAVAKLAAGRAKDREFITAIVDARMLDIEAVRERVAMLPTGTDARVVASILSFLDGLDARSANTHG